MMCFVRHEFCLRFLFVILGSFNCSVAFPGHRPYDSRKLTSWISLEPWEFVLDMGSSSQ